MSLISYIRAGSNNQITSPYLGIVGAITGTPVYQSGPFGGAMRAADSGYYVQAGLINNLRDRGTIEHWLLFNVVPTTSTRYVRGWQAQRIYNNDLTLAFADGNYPGDAIHHMFIHKDNTLSFVKTFIVSTWYHIACVWDKDGIDGGADTRRVYIDDVLLANDSFAIGSINVAAVDFWMGKYPGGSGYAADAVYDNIKIYDYAKTDFSDRWAEKPGYAKRRGG